MRDIHVAIDQFRSNSALYPVHGGHVLDRTGHPVLAVLDRTSNSDRFSGTGNTIQYFTNSGSVYRTRTAGFQG